MHPVDPVGGQELTEINTFGSVEIIARLHVEIFKPTLDNRYSSNEIVSHNHDRIPSKLV